MIIQSGNDAAIALAEHVAGSEETFAQLMNQYAAQLGMTGTHYVDASGLPNPEHYTTAHDVALLSRALIHDIPRNTRSTRSRNSSGTASSSTTATPCCGAIRPSTASRPATPRGGFLPGDLGQARRPAPDRGRDGRAEREAARRRQPGTARTTASVSSRRTSSTRRTSRWRRRSCGRARRERAARRRRTTCWSRCRAAATAISRRASTCRRGCRADRQGPDGRHAEGRARRQDPARAPAGRARRGAEGGFFKRLSDGVWMWFKGDAGRDTSAIRAAATEKRVMP